MGNAAAEGLSHAVPEKGADYDMIVFGLQESTYAVRRSSSLEKDEVVMRSMMSNDESDCEGGGSTNVSDCENSDTVAAVAASGKEASSLDACERLSNTSNVSDAGKDMGAMQEPCVVQLLADITAILQDDFYLVNNSCSPAFLFL